MARERRTLPLYQRYRNSGTLAQNVAGVEAALRAGDDIESGSVTWLVRAESLGGLIPAAGDYMRDTAGRWWEVKAVAPLADGAYPCACVRWNDGEAI